MTEPAAGGPRGGVVGAIVLAAGVAGFAALGSSLPSVVVPALLAAVVAVALLPDQRKAGVLELLGALVTAVAVLVGCNVLLDAAARELGLFEHGTPKWTIVTGLVFATLVFGAAASWYLWARGHWRLAGALATGGTAAVLLVVITPIVVPKLLDSRRATRTVASERERVVSKLDVLIVAERPRDPPTKAAFVPERANEALDVRYSVGFADGHDVRWALVDAITPDKAIDTITTGEGRASSPPRPRAGADRVLVLLIDGTPAVTAKPAELPVIDAERGGEIGRWQGLAKAAAAGTLPSFALLQTTAMDRLERWERDARPLTPISVQAFASQTVTDAAVRLAVGAPTARQDYSLALRHRPVLLFDRMEPVPRPLSVAGMLAAGDVTQCDDDGATCKTIRDPARLSNPDTHLELDLPQSDVLSQAAKRELDALKRARAAATDRGEGPATATGDLPAGAAPPGTPPPGTLQAGQPATSSGPTVAGSSVILGNPLSTMYVHPSSREVNRTRLLFLDYWWYLPDNPTRAGKGAFCGAGFVIPGVSCFDHVSDWEGVTVVVDRTPGRTVAPVSVHYAQHDGVVRYPWKRLRAHWDRHPSLPPFVAGLADGDDRPLVFVARGTHASYATPCPDDAPGDCRQLVADLGEEPHDGTLAWAGSETGACGPKTDCLELLPTRVGGTQAALWNAFRGPWGTRRCVLSYYCDSTTPPSAPGSQRRFRDPQRYTGTGDLDNPDDPFDPGVGIDE